MMIIAYWNMDVKFFGSVASLPLPQVVDPSLHDIVVHCRVGCQVVQSYSQSKEKNSTQNNAEDPKGDSPSQLTWGVYDSYPSVAIAVVGSAR